MTNVIGIGGQINSGKSEAAKMLAYLLNSPKWMRNYTMYKWCKGKTFGKKWNVTSFADALKTTLAVLLNVKRACFEDRWFKEEVYVNPNTLNLVYTRPKNSSTLSDNKFNKLIEYKDWNSIKNHYITIRQLMQLYGTHIAPLCFGENVWVNTALRGKKPLIISDVRFEKEANAIHAIPGSKIILIKRPGTTQTSNHISEKELIKIQENKVPDYIICNDKGLDHLFDQLKSIVLCLDL